MAGKRKQKPKRSGVWDLGVQLDSALPDGRGWLLLSRDGHRVTRMQVSWRELATVGLQMQATAALLAQVAGVGEQAYVAELLALSGPAAEAVTRSLNPEGGGA